MSTSRRCGPRELLDRSVSLGGWETSTRYDRLRYLPGGHHPGRRVAGTAALGPGVRPVRRAASAASSPLSIAHSSYDATATRRSSSSSSTADPGPATTGASTRTTSGSPTADTPSSASTSAARPASRSASSTPATTKWSARCTTTSSMLRPRRLRSAVTRAARRHVARAACRDARVPTRPTGTAHATARPGWRWRWVRLRRSRGPTGDDLDRRGGCRRASLDRRRGPADLYHCRLFVLRLCGFRLRLLHAGFDLGAIYLGLDVRYPHHLTAAADAQPCSSNESREDAHRPASRPDTRTAGGVDRLLPDDAPIVHRPTILPDRL